MSPDGTDQIGRSANSVSHLSVRPLSADDGLLALTSLVHSAYAPHAERGLRFWGTHQSVEDTAERFSTGQGFVAEVDGEVVGTITLRPPQPESPVALYRLADVWSFCQFAVAPAQKRRGVGVALHEHALVYASSLGAKRMALDTATPATGFIRMYKSWGYEACGHCDWRPHTNYVSTLMVRDIAAGGSVC